VTSIATFRSGYGNSDYVYNQYGFSYNFQDSIGNLILKGCMGSPGYISSPSYWNSPVYMVTGFTMRPENDREKTIAYAYNSGYPSGIVPYYVFSAGDSFYLMEVLLIQSMPGGASVSSIQSGQVLCEALLIQSSWPINNY